MAKEPTVFLATPQGTGIRYFFQTDIVPWLLREGVSVVGIVPNPEEVGPQLEDHLPGLVVERLCVEADSDDPWNRLSRLKGVSDSIVHYLRWAGVSRRANRAVFRSVQRHRERILRRGKMRYLVPALRAAGGVMQRSRTARQLYRRYVESRPVPDHHQQLFARYEPDLVVTSSPGWWRGDEIMIREARRQGVPTVAILIGWDHTSSQGLPPVHPDRVRAWSGVQRDELIEGYDLDPDSIDVGGVAHFDFYQRDGFALPREEYFARRGLDPHRRLISFGCSFVGISSNVGMVRALAEAASADRFDFPVELLVRLHPTHFKTPGWQYVETSEEVTAYEQMARELAHVHLEYPDLNSEKLRTATTIDDAVNLASLLRHSDVFVTLFSTMVLEAAVNDTPTVSVAMDPPGEWQRERYLSITQALDWPTHQRIIQSGASAVATTPEAMVKAVNAYLHDPSLDSEARRRFALQEATYLDGHSGERIAAYIAEAASKRMERPRVSREPASAP